MMKDGNIRFAGKPAEVITPQTMKEIYDVDCKVISSDLNQILIQYM